MHVTVAPSIFPPSPALLLWTASKAQITRMSSDDVEKCDPASAHNLAKTESAVSATVVDSQPKTPSSHSLVDAYPDGGLKAWLSVAGAFLGLLCTFGQLTSFGTFQSWYAEHQLQQFPPATISWIGSLQLWFFFFSVKSVSYVLWLYALTFPAGRLHRPHLR